MIPTLIVIYLTNNQVGQEYRLGSIIANFNTVKTPLTGNSLGKFWTGTFVCIAFLVKKNASC